MPLTFVVISVLSVASALIEDGAKPANGPTLFRQVVKPVLTGKCLNCHDGVKRKGKLDLTRKDRALKGGESGPAFVPGKPEESLLYQKVSTAEMPPQNPLSAEQVAAFKKWIETGAPYEGEPLSAQRPRAGADWWSLKPIRSPAIPQVKNRGW